MFEITIQVLIDHDKLNKRRIVDMLHNGLNRYVIEDVRFRGFQLYLTISSELFLRQTTIEKDLQQIFSAKGKESWLNTHTDLRIENIQSKNEKKN